MIRLTGEYSSLYGDLYKVEILDKSGGSSGIFSMNGGYDISPRGEPRNPHKVFNPSECSFTMYIDPANSAHRTFIEDLKGAAENRFFVRCWHNGNLDFAGPIKMDAVSYQDVPDLYEFTVVASDGISGTAGIDYSDTGGVAYTGRVTYMEHIINVLQKIGVDFLYGGDDAVTVVVNWYASEMTGIGTENPWDQAGVDHELFINRGEDGKPDFMKCMDVLRILLTPFHACLRYGNGRYWIEQIPERTKVTFVGWTYSLDGTLRQVQTWNLDSLVQQNKSDWRNSKFSLRDRTYTFLPALREVNVRYTYDEEIHGVAKDITFSSFSGDTCSPNLVSNTPNSNIIFRVTGQLRLKTEVTNTELIDNGWTQHRYYFKMRIRVGNDQDWFERTLDKTDFFNITANDGEWKNSISYIEIASPILERADNSKNTYIPFIFETKVYDNGILPSVLYMLCFEADGVKDSGHNNLNGEYTTEWAFENVEISVVDPAALEGKARSRTEKIKGSNNTDNTATLEIDTILGDNKTLKNSILIKDGSDWIPPTMWGVAGAGTHDSILKLLIDEALALRTKPLEIASMAITGSGYTVLTTGRYTWQGINYLFDVGTKMSRMNTMRGDYFGLSRAPITSVKTIVNLVNKVDRFATKQDESGIGVDIPTLDNEGITLISGSIPQGSTISTIAIPAALYNYFRTGDVIEVRDPGTGNKMKFTVSQNVNKGDTVINVTPVLTTAVLGEGSKVIFDWAYESGQTYNETKERYEFFSVDNGNVTVGATELTITEFALPPVGTPLEQARKRVRPERNGVKLRMVPDVASYTGAQPLRVFSIDSVNSKIKLHSTAPVDSWDEFDVFAFEIVK